jgi:predicted transcriptional regulator
MPYKVTHVRLEQEGFSKVLGALEAEIMEVMWSAGEAGVRAVLDGLSAKRAYSFNTVMTVMNRLVVKKLLSKKMSGGAYVYAPLVGRDDLSRQVTRSVVGALIKDGSLFQAAAFADALKECSDEDLKALKRIIDEQA